MKKLTTGFAGLLVASLLSLPLLAQEPVGPGPGDPGVGARTDTTPDTGTTTTTTRNNNLDDTTDDGFNPGWLGLLGLIGLAGLMPRDRDRDRHHTHVGTGTTTATR